MKTTTNLIAGELDALDRQLAKTYMFPAFTRMYSKRFYDHNFAVKIGRALQMRHTDKTVVLEETDYEYILRVEGWEDAPN